MIKIKTFSRKFFWSRCNFGLSREVTNHFLSLDRVACLSLELSASALICSDELYCPLDQSCVAVAGTTNAVKARQSEAVTVSLFFRHPNPHAINPTTPTHPYPPTGICTLPSFARIERPRWRPVELNDRHLGSHGKLGDNDQSKSLFSFKPNQIFEVAFGFHCCFARIFSFIFDNDGFILD